MPLQNPSGPRTVREQVARVQAYREASGREDRNNMRLYDPSTGQWEEGLLPALFQ